MFLFYAVTTIQHAWSRTLKHLLQSYVGVHFFSFFISINAALLTFWVYVARGVGDVQRQRALP